MPAGQTHTVSDAVAVPLLLGVWTNAAAVVFAFYRRYYAGAYAGLRSFDNAHSHVVPSVWGLWCACWARACALCRGRPRVAPAALQTATPVSAPIAAPRVAQVDRRTATATHRQPAPTQRTPFVLRSAAK